MASMPPGGPRGATPVDRLPDWVVGVGEPPGVRLRAPKAPKDFGYGVVVWREVWRDAQLRDMRTAWLVENAPHLTDGAGRVAVSREGQRRRQASIVR